MEYFKSFESNTNERPNTIIKNTIVITNEKGEVQDNPMLEWFFDRREHSVKDEYYKEWQEYVKKADLNAVYTIKEYNSEYTSIAQHLFIRHDLYDDEFFEYALQFIKEQKWLNFLLRCTTDRWIYDSLDLEKNKRIIKLLVDKGANINAYFYSWPNNFQPLIFFVRPFSSGKIENANRLKLLHFFLELGADPNLKNSEGENLLHEFIIGKNQKFINALIDSGKIKDINEAIIECGNETIRAGNSALIQAIMKGCSSTVKKLIKAGANVNVFYHTGYSALDLTEVETFFSRIGKQRETIKKYLLEAGAKSSLELLGSEEKLEEFRAQVWNKYLIGTEIKETYQKQCEDNYYAILEKTPSAFKEYIELIEE
ncbi:hypothetical protein CQA75_06020 [Campylobacter taeniopygiae]|uniref:Ankyrin repeat domain-containing protein n=2 Tax=Campylobacter taeniopygiae TaxID=2510188 RepID=A0ABY2TMG5_9BACT|nr:hypothetical protein CQA75_06020 [Campylobacter taeniopygiae]